MMRLIAITLLACLSTPAAKQSEGIFTVDGVIVKSNRLYDQTAQVDIVLKMEEKGRFIRLRYAPQGFGFDAPPGTPGQLIPKARFGESKITWSFQVHKPQGGEEQAACAEHPSLLIPRAGGGFLKRDPFVVVGTHGNEKIPSPWSLDCAVIERWSIKRDAGEYLRKE